MSRILTVEETATACQVTTRTVYDWLTRGRIPGRKVGKVWRVPEEALLEFLRGERTDLGRVPEEE